MAEGDGRGCPLGLRGARAWAVSSGLGLGMFTSVSCGDIPLGILKCRKTKNTPCMNYSTNPLVILLLFISVVYLQLFYMYSTLISILSLYSTCGTELDISSFTRVVFFTK